MSRYRWVVLALGMGAQASFAAVMQGLPAIGPALRAQYGLSLPALGATFGALTLGATVTLVPWGMLTDRLGERRTLAAGMAGLALAIWGATLGGAGVLVSGLAAGGAFGAVANVASGSAVSRWFRTSERGLAMGLRQAAVPLGGALAAVTLPVLATGHVRNALIALAVAGLAAAVACGVWVRTPAREAARRGPGPLRDRRIWRLASGSALLITTQVALVAFVVVYLHDERGFSNPAAGAVLAVISVAGMGGRIAAGRWSDRLVLRLGPLRRIAAATAVAWAVVPFLLHGPDTLVVVAVVVGGTLASSWNGLSFTATAEFAAGGRSATAIALQQTALFATAAVVPPLFGLLVEAAGWRVAFWVLAVGPALAWWVLAPLASTERASFTG